MKTRLIPVLITVWLVLWSASNTAAHAPASQPGAIGPQAIGSNFTYQGYLTSGGSAANGTFDFSFRLFNAASGGTQINAIERGNVNVSNGVFTVDLDFGFDAFPGDPRFLEIGVRPGTSTGAYTTLTPRQSLAAVPYALFAQNIPLEGSGSAPTAAHSDHDHFAAVWSGTALDGLNVENDSTQSGASGVYGRITSTSPGGGSGGVWGYNEGTGSNGIGVVGIQNGSGWGVYGEATTGGLGVVGYTSGGTTSVPNTGIGVRGVSDSTNGFGVYGIASNGQFARGMWGFSSSGTGVGGGSTATNGTGVYGIVSGANATGVYGISTNASSFAGNFDGNVRVNGNLEVVGVKNFVIDHPLDPANKYLYHAAVESPDMKNVYDGVVTLGADGAAVVTLPDYFEALNQDFRYQLTAIGAPGPNLYVAEEIKNNRFSIAGGKPGAKVSWQVTGIRHDPYAEQHRMQTEVAKSAPDRGMYLYPQGYGKPASAGINYQKQQQAAQSIQQQQAAQTSTLSNQNVPHR